ncbi:MAG: tripartite tricarboxylate transporter substrate binding protein [Burkholderiaceae bacterium]|jgi:tripartite-type tricarboxylate transporter receptor subunit TctC|nr:tripartite tricarboxylate transporter substrate binding protein [Burkholderiaceae bacterium]
MMALLGAAALHAQAQPAYPQRPVTIVVAFPPGGMTDIVSRSLAKELGDALKQPFVVDNRAGAAGQVGTEYVARKPADGYTLLVSSTGYVTGPVVQKKVNYDPIKSFEPIAVLAKAPNLLVVNPSVPARTVPEFLSWAKVQPSVPFATSGVGGTTHLAGELLRHESGLPMVHVPYKGAAPAIIDTVAGQISVAFQDSMSVSSFVASGRLRPLATASAQRSSLFPDLPTLNESGFKNFDIYTWLGLYAPAGTPHEIVGQLNQAVNKIMNSPEMVKRLREQYSEPVGALNLAQMREFVAHEAVKYRDMVDLAGVKVED